ncbi:unnamed protein product [Clavelina lepadiformis]|uniref:Peptidase S1 domain-containing protein n=1 Tax=Clavelina lepadiformis TaxID=159417 RepID=A0ABP0FZX9_CLALP
MAMELLRDNNQDKECGLRYLPKMETNKRIPHGQSVEVNEFPWHVAVWRHDQTICGGVLLTRNRILTAAHCIEECQLNNFGFQDRYETCTEKDNSYLDWLCLKKGKYSAIVGKGILSTLSEHHQRKEVFNVTQAYILPNYENRLGALANDFAVLHVERPEEEDFDQPVHLGCLWRGSMNNAPTRSCIAVGYGRTKTAPYSRILQKVNVAVNDCNEKYPTYFFKCVNANHKEQVVGCQGDSGSPVICPIDPNNNCSPYFVAGLLSTNENGARGVQCINDNKYSVINRLDNPYLIDNLQLERPHVQC